MSLNLSLTNVTVNLNNVLYSLSLKFIYRRLALCHPEVHKYMVGTLKGSNLFCIF